MTNPNQAMSMAPAPVIATQPVNDLASISVSARIPEFWVDMPRLWFAQFDSVMDPQKQGDSAKYNMVIAKLSRDALQQVGDIIYDPLKENKFAAIKARLLSAYEESAEKQFNKLVGEMDLGTQRPSQLLRRMSALASNTQVSTEALRRLWIARLPMAVRTVLSVAQSMKLDDLATMADKIVENIQTSDIAAIASTSTSAPLPDLLSQMRQMTLEIQELRREVNEVRGRSMGRGNSWNRSRSRSQSRGPRRTPESKDWLCKYHYRWKNHAKSCEKPCNWKQPGNSDRSGN